MKKRTIRDLGWLAAVLLLLSGICSVLSGSVRADRYDAERYITITLHAGEGAYFEEPGVTEIESVQFRGDVFSERRIPVSEDPTMLFVGWSSEEGSDYANVRDGVTNNSMVGTDLYAVFTNECFVNYIVFDGEVEMEDGSMQTHIRMQYEKGQLFRDLQPVHYDPEDYDFAGWYAGTWDTSPLYTANTAINEPETDVWARWRIAEDRVRKLETGLEYTVEIERGAAVYGFTPEATGVYSIRTFGHEDTDFPVNITATDAELNKIRDSKTVDSDGNAALTMSMEGGRSYYFHLSEQGGRATHFSFSIEETESAAVTFHVNRDEKKDAWFDGDRTKTEKVLRIAFGEDISKYDMTGIEFENMQVIQMFGWSVDPNAESRDDRLIVRGDMDVYAVIEDLKAIPLDANGGYFPLQDMATVSAHLYIPGTPFLPTFDPKIDDNTVKFAGWSLDPNAERPDEDIIEGVTICDDIKGTLYAVYTEKVLETFNANGGYMLDDPSIEIFNSTKGVGHIFYGMVVRHQNSRMRVLCWEDQNGERIPYTSDIYPYYHVNGDTEYTAVWGYKVILDANGGYFPEIEAYSVGVYLEQDSVFNEEEISDLIGEVTNKDGRKIFLGWATTRDATEPDVFHDVTPVRDLDRIYAVWGEDTYYFEEGEYTYWEKSYDEGLRFVVKREVYDSETYSDFSGVSVDGTKLSAGEFTASEGSLILTLSPEYLRSLEAGDHYLAIDFSGKEIGTYFTVYEPEEATEPESDPYGSEDPYEPTYEEPTYEEPSYEEPDDPYPTEHTETDRPARREGGFNPFWTSLIVMAAAGAAIFVIDRKKKKNDTEPAVNAAEAAAEEAREAKAQEEKDWETLEKWQRVQEHFRRNKGEGDN